MKVHLYRVSYTKGDREGLTSLLDEYIRKPDCLPLRASKHFIRLDNIEKNNHMYFISMVKARIKNVPGKICEREKIVNIELNPEEDFGEDTLCLFDPHTNILLLESHQNSLKHKQIETYFNPILNVQGVKIELHPVCNKKIHTELLMKDKIIRKFKTKISSADINLFKDQDLGLSSMIDLHEATGFSDLEITLTVKKGKKLKEDGIRNFLSTLTPEENDQILKDIEISTANGENDVSDSLLPLFGEKITYTETDLSLTNTKRICADAKKTILLKAHLELQDYFG